LEWNSKDQTFDRDLYAFNAFSLCGVIDAAVLVTRSVELNAVFRALGQALDRDGNPDVKRDGTPRLTREKYGASTTWMGKLLYRLNAGRNGGCPVLAIGIRPACISDWKAP
jgi:CRISPR-associated protein Csd2